MGNCAIHCSTAKRNGNKVAPLKRKKNIFNIRGDTNKLTEQKLFLVKAWTTERTIGEMAQCPKFRREIGLAFNKKKKKVKRKDSHLKEQYWKNKTNIAAVPGMALHRTDKIQKDNYPYHGSICRMRSERQSSDGEIVIKRMVFNSDEPDDYQFINVPHISRCAEMYCVLEEATRFTSKPEYTASSIVRETRIQTVSSIRPHQVKYWRFITERKKDLALEDTGYDSVIELLPGYSAQNDSKRKHKFYTIPTEPVELTLSSIENYPVSLFMELSPERPRSKTS